MKYRICSGVIALMMTASAWGADVSQALKTAAQQASKALCHVECKIEIAGEETTRNGIGVCIDASSGMVMTLAIPPQTSINDIREVTLTPVGNESKPLRAKLQGMDTLSGLSFLRCEEKHAFSAVEFLTSAGVSPGDLVVSAGLDVAAPGKPLALGAGYISSARRAPNRVLRVTGGTLSATGSVVFNTDGKAIGLVTTQPFVPFQTYRRGRGAQTLVLRNLEQTVSFTPVEEFVQILTNIPSQGVVRRPNWIGGLLVAVPESLREAKGLTGTAVMFDHILPGSSATKVGLKNRDIVVGVNGAPIADMGNDKITAGALRQKFARMKPGDSVALTVRSDSGPREVSVQVEPMPLTASEAPRLYQKELGFVLREKIPFDRVGDDATAGQSGMIVLAVVKNSLAAEGKLKTGDLLVNIDGKTVTTVPAAEKALAGCLDQDPPRDVGVIVLRGKTAERLTIKSP